jgi:flagellar basal-body rod modification protein FlgD
MGSVAVTQPISNLTSTTKSTSSGDTLDANSFLTLLTTELENQDPSDAADTTQSVTQLAQFTMTQDMAELQQSFAGFQSNFGVLQAASLVGKQVTVNVTGGSGNSSTETGTVSTIDVENGTPYFTMTNSSGSTISDPSTGQPLLFSLSQIEGIGGAATTTTGSQTSSAKTSTVHRSNGQL